MKGGNSLAMTLPKPLWDNYEINKGDSLDIVTMDRGIFIPVKPKESAFIKKELEQALKSVVNKGRKG